MKKITIALALSITAIIGAIIMLLILLGIIDLSQLQLLFSIDNGTDLTAGGGGRL